MEIKQLECFVASVESGSFTKAAEVLYMNQSNVSRMVKNLEEDLNITLFIRNNKGIFLTIEGERIYRKSKDLLFRIEHFGGEKEKKKCDNFTVSTFPSNYIAFAYAKLCMNHKTDSTIFRLFSKGTSEILRQLEKYVADIGFIYSSKKQERKLQHILDKRKLDFFPLCKAVPVLYIGKYSPYYEKEKISKEELKRLNYFKVDHDYHENYYNLTETIRYYGLENKLNQALIIDNGYSMTQMLNHTEFCYLGHAWLNEKTGKIITNSKDYTVYDHFITLKSIDGDICMGYVLRQQEKRLTYCEELLELITQIN